MPITYSVSSDGLFVHAIATEPLTTEDVLVFQKDLQHDSRVKPGFKALFDESRISESRIDEQGLQAIIARETSDEAKRPARLAIVAGPGSSFPRALEYEKMVAPAKETVIVFHNEDIARQWLDVPHSDK
jgi:hypothetical protein